MNHAISDEDTLIRRVRPEVALRAAYELQSSFDNAGPQLTAEWIGGVVRATGCQGEGPRLAHKCAAMPK
jgi:hypothetical protein